MSKPVWRKAVKLEAYTPPHGRTLSATSIILECGHDAFRKASQKMPKKFQCRQCQLMRDGNSSGSIWTERGIREVWDHETQMPKIVSIEPSATQATNKQG